MSFSWVALCYALPGGWNETSAPGERNSSFMGALGTPDWYVGWYNSLRWVEAFRSEFLTTIAHAFSHSLRTWFLLSLLGVGYWLHRKEVFIRACTATCLAVFLNAHLKSVFEIARPSEIPPLEDAEGSSFPSGHVQIISTLFLWLGLEFRRRWFWWAAGLLIAGVSLSRMYLGVHTPIDVAVGLLVGGATVLGGWWAVQRGEVAWKAIPDWLQVVLLVLVLGTWLAILPNPERETADPAFFVTFFLPGFWLGVFLDKRYLDYRPPVGWLQRFLIGVGGVLGLRYCPRLVEAYFELLLGIHESGLYPSFFLSGLMISWILPWSFLRLGLARTTLAQTDITAAPS